MNFSSNYHSKFPVNSIMKSVIDNLNVTLIFDIFEFLSWKPHYSIALLTIDSETSAIFAEIM